LDELRGGGGANPTDTSRTPVPVIPDEC
jgi:hypothetical protein